MTEEVNPQFLPVREFINAIESGNLDLTQLKTILIQLKDTTFGQNLAHFLDVVASNTGAHAILRGALHPRGKDQEFYHDNLPIRQFVANRIERDTSYSFNPQESSPQEREELWKALQAFTGISVDSEAREKINLKLPNKFPPSIYKVEWVGDDEVVVREDNIYSIDRDLVPGHYLNVNEALYTVYKGGKLQGRATFTEISDYDTITNQSSIFTKVTDMPLSQTQFTDRISGKAKNEFIYLNPDSPYLKPNSRNS